MLDEFLKREDVSKLLIDICNSARYYDKKNTSSMGYQMYFGVEQILFLFYDALFKYKIIIDDMDYFNDFFEQIDKLIRKIDNFCDISNGINRIIGRLCAYKLDIKDIDDDNSKEEVLRYIHNAYIVNGYYIHGYNSHYFGDILEYGFRIEQYDNLYNKFEKVQMILKKKKHFGILDKDFSEKKVTFTDSLLMGCYYSANSPMFFSKMLCRNEFINDHEEVDAYSKNDYNSCLKNLYKVMSKLKLSEYEKSIFLDAFKSQWKLLDKSNSNISLMLVSRKDIKDNVLNIDLFLEENKKNSFSECICRLLGQKNTIISYNNIDKKKIKLLNLYGYKKFVKEEKKDTLKSELEKTFITSDDEFAFSNAYGKVSMLLLTGTILITLGVLFTIIMFS